MATERSTKVKVRADVQDAIRDFDRLEDAVEDVGDQVKQTSRESDGLKKLGAEAQNVSRGLAAIGAGSRDVRRTADALDDAGDEAQQLDRAIDQVTAEIRRLNQEMLRTGDVSLFGQIQEQRGALSALQRIRRELGSVEQEGRAAGSGLASSLAAVPATMKGGLILGIVGAGVTAAPLLGAVVSAAVIGGVGAGGILGGVIAASQSAQVQSAAGDMVDRLNRPFRRIGAAFADDVVEALDVLGDAGEDILGDLTPDLRALAPQVVTLARGLADMGRMAAPGFAAALRAARPLLDAFASELPGLGRTIGTVLEMISGGGEEAAEGLRTLIFIAEASLISSAAVIRGLSEAFGLFKEATDNPALLAFTGVGGVFVHAANQSRTAIKDLSTETGESVLLVNDFTEATGLAAIGMNRAAFEAGGLKNALDILNGGILGTRAAEREFEASLDAVNDALERNGQTIDVNTEAGRSNMDVLDAIANSGMAWAEQIFNSTRELEGLEEAQAAANEVIARSKEEFINAAIALGMEEEAVRDLADAIFVVPDNWTSNGSTNADKLKKEIEDFIRAVENIPDGRTVTITTRHVNQFLTQEFGAQASTAERWGGIVAAQHGALIPAHVTTSPTVLYGERATRKEAFVPMQGDPRRSVPILSEAAGWYGMQVVPAGALAPMQVTAVAGGDGTFVGELYLDSGEFLGKVRGEVRREQAAHDQEMLRGLSQGVGAAP